MSTIGYYIYIFINNIIKYIIYNNNGSNNGCSINKLFTLRKNIYLWAFLIFYDKISRPLIN